MKIILVYRVLLQRNDAISFLKELIGNCNPFNPEGLALETSSKGCKVVISGNFDAKIFGYVQSLASKYQLDVEEKTDAFLVYEKMRIPHV